MGNRTEAPPRAWVGCLGCYNSGRLVGDWLTPDEVREKYGEPTTCPRCGSDEFAAMDTEGVPRGVGESVPAFLEWCEMCEELDDDERAVLLAWCENHHIGHDFARAWSDASDCFRGCWGSFRDFVEELCADLWHESVPADLWRYLDFDAVARDFGHDYWTAEHDSGVLIFSND